MHTSRSTVTSIPATASVVSGGELRSTRRRAAAAMAGAAGLAIAGFTALGSIFDYPKILKEPTAHILREFHAHEGGVTSWFGVLVVSAGLLAPLGVWLGRLAATRNGEGASSDGRWITRVGIAAATVQVIGLSRWLLLIPGVSDDALDPAKRADAFDRFELLHTVLGKVIGETIGYALTATFTVLVVRAITKVVAPRWMSIVGYVSAGLIATGVFIPLVGALSIANFAGYVGWCLWLIGMAVALWRAGDR